jgi:hypothetical protein
MKTELILIIIIAIYILFTLFVRKKIVAAYYLKEERRRLHKKLIWFIPFLGPLMLRAFWKERKENIEVKTKFTRKKDRSGFYESGIGIKSDFNH